MKSSDDVMSLLLTVDAVRRINSQTQIKLTLPYVPYARQDRVCEKGEALSIVVMAKLINSLNCRKVIISDPHSDVTSALIKNVEIKTITDFVRASALEQLIHKENLELISPDAGAEKKIRKLAQSLNNVNMIAASKVRDTATGRILETHVMDVKPNQAYLIADDICDGGRTFIELAKVLKNNGASDLYLYVTHGIFSKGLAELNQYFKRIYCVNSWLDAEKHKNLIILED